jgi:hypothetical protein
VTELHAAARVVIDEYKLQQAIQTEKDALHFKGVFIPLLKSRKDLRDDDLVFYRRQQQARDQDEANEAAAPPAPTQEPHASQVPFSPQQRDHRHPQEELYDDDNRRGTSHFHFNSTHLEPPAPSSSAAAAAAPAASSRVAAAAAAPVTSSTTTGKSRQDLPNDRYYQADFDENE